MKVKQLENQIVNMEQSHKETVGLLREAHAKQMQAARELPGNAMKSTATDLLPQTDLDLIKGIILFFEWILIMGRHLFDYQL